jgi:hypothetical protein
VDQELLTLLDSSLFTCITWVCAVNVVNFRSWFGVRYDFRVKRCSGLYSQLFY